MAAIVTNQSFLRNVCSTAKAGVAAVQTGGDAASQYAAYFAAAIAANNASPPYPDFAGQFADLTPTDIANAVTAIAAVQSVLTANSNVYLNYLLKIAR